MKITGQTGINMPVDSAQQIVTAIQNMETQIIAAL